jgi:hypothetical protein
LVDKAVSNTKEYVADAEVSVQEKEMCFCEPVLTARNNTTLA